MHTLVSSITIVALFVHGLIGCCWRPAPSESRTACAGYRPAVCCQSRGEGATGQNEAPCSPCPGESPCRGLCTYVSPQKTLVDHSPLPVSFETAAIVSVSGGGASAPSLWNPAAEGVPWEPSLRLHLFHQVMLI
jgi:hypothetical protein